MTRAIKKIMILGLALVVLFSLVACDSDKKVIERVEKHSGIKLPSDIEVIFNCRFINTVHGSPQPIYTVFGFKEKPQDFLNDNGFASNTEKELDPPRIYKQYKQITEEFYPPWHEEFVWTVKNDVTLIYFLEQQKLFALQTMG